MVMHVHMVSAIWTILIIYSRSIVGLRIIRFWLKQYVFVALVERVMQYTLQFKVKTLSRVVHILINYAGPYCVPLSRLSSVTLCQRGQCSCPLQLMHTFMNCIMIMDCDLCLLVTAVTVIVLHITFHAIYLHMIRHCISLVYICRVLLSCSTVATACSTVAILLKVWESAGCHR